MMADEFNSLWSLIQNHIAEADADFIPVPGQLELHGRCRCGVLLSLCFGALCVAYLIVGMEEFELHCRPRLAGQTGVYWPVLQGLPVVYSRIAIGLACYRGAEPPNPKKCSRRCLGKCQPEVGCSGKCPGECSARCLRGCSGKCSSSFLLC